ncbi:MAG TPA: hypothetical protein VK430_02235 [Xanthobacteraceae bacterium]|nr:hypothetical protein [Xanthobacteraceae bacterium]
MIGIDDLMAERVALSDQWADNLGAHRSPLGTWKRRDDASGTRQNSGIIDRNFRILRPIDRNRAFFALTWIKRARLPACINPSNARIPDAVPVAG